MAQEKRELDLATLLRERRQQELFSDGTTPKKDPAEVTAEPPGPAETWPIALLPHGEDGEKIISFLQDALQRAREVLPAALR